jgi:murein DD-endopeptidase MepM/ murein hydrolase activator NlpD
VFADLGVRPPRNDGWFSEASIGGPFLPFARPPEDPFARQIHRVRTTADTVERLKESLSALPVRKPIASAADVTSPFGMRVDPFVRQMALHTGVDFKGEPGDPVRAAAGGKVTEAGRNGGYGLMVEVDHGNGLVTRYAHLSGIDVSEGTVVKPGDAVGRVGSTGRSTGPHLHFEVRLNGDPVDPQKYLRAGLRLFEPL